MTYGFLRKKELYLLFVFAGPFNDFSRASIQNGDAIDNGDYYTSKYKNVSKVKEKRIEWQWDDNYTYNLVEHNGFQYVYTFNEQDNFGKIIQKDSFGSTKKIWERQEVLICSSSLLTHDDTIYIGLYAHTSTGCRVLAINISSGGVIWEKQAQGLGSIGHSRYSNSVQIRMIENKLVLFGWELEGKYIEILDSNNGSLILNRKE